MKTNRFLLAAGVMLALAFAFGCSSDGDGDKQSSGSGLDSGTVSCLVNGVCTSLALDACIEIGGAEVQSCSVLSSSSVEYVDGSCDIKDYRTINIGDQIWMAENLNCNVIGSKCYNNDPANCAIYGRLYDWATAMALPSSCNSSKCSSRINAKHKGICPSGWHIGSNADWDALITAVGGSSIAGRKLKATSGWSHCGHPSTADDFIDHFCEDAYEFSALPGGYGNSNDDFGTVGRYGYWWSASEHDNGNAYRMYIDYNHDYVGYSNYDKGRLFSVRCMKD